MKRYIHKLHNPRKEPGETVPFKQWQREQRPVVMCLRPPSKTKAKHDKVAIKYARANGIKMALAPETGYASAGHCNRFTGNSIEETRQF